MNRGQGSNRAEICSTRRKGKTEREKKKDPRANPARVESSRPRFDSCHGCFANRTRQSTVKREEKRKEKSFDAKSADSLGVFDSCHGCFANRTRQSTVKREEKRKEKSFDAKSADSLGVFLRAVSERRKIAPTPRPGKNEFGSFAVKDFDITVGRFNRERFFGTQSKSEVNSKKKYEPRKSFAFQRDVKRWRCRRKTKDSVGIDCR